MILPPRKPLSAAMSFFMKAIFQVKIGYPPYLGLLSPRQVFLPMLHQAQFICPLIL
jgi:hypothetical protein